MTKADGILVRSTDEMESMVLFLEAHGLRREWMGFAVSRCPQLLSLSFDDLRSRMQFDVDMGMNQDFGTMVFDHPKALGFFSLELMNAKAEYIKQFGLTNEEIGRLLAFKPQLMGRNIEEKWKPLVKYLYYLGVQHDGMKRIVTIKPSIFCVDLQTIITPKVIYLITKAGVTRAEIGKVIALEPELMGCSIHDKLEVNVKYFLSLGIHLQSLGQMVADFPMLLKYTLDILQPKYRYLRATMVHPVQELIEFPWFFSYSLEGRIIPRHKILVENKVNFQLRHMLASPDDEFKLKVKNAVERCLSFEASSNNSMKDGGQVL